MEKENGGEDVNVAITGPLSLPRAEVAALINSTKNGHFVEYVTFKTHYLVSTKQDSQKARKAARLGTAVITEAELQAYLDSNQFPSTKLPKRPSSWGLHLPNIAWTRKDQPQICLMTYCCARGLRTIRQILWVSSGVSPSSEGGDQWVGGYDGPQFKSWRADRIVELEVLETPEDMRWSEA